MLRDSILNAQPRPVTPYYGLVTRIIQNQVERILEGVPVEEAVEALEQQLSDARLGR